MRILITGADGLLGYELQRVLRRHEVVACVWPEFDLLKPDDVECKIADARPDVVIHAAAYTNVDQAEREPGLAMAVNAEGTATVARATAKAGARLVYISTDYVFDGAKRTPYRESDEPNPLNIYGQSKREGERQALAGCPNTLVVRTAWLYGAHGHNFVKTIMRLAGEKPLLQVVADQRGSPTHAGDLAEALGAVLSKDLRGVIHATGGGDCTWEEFAREIVARMDSLVPVEPITTKQAGQSARRPAYAVLSNQALNQAGITLPHWRDALARFIIQSRSITTVHS